MWHRPPDEYRWALTGHHHLVDAAFMVGNPSCGFCTGIQGVLADDEACVAVLTRNFKGRMGATRRIYLASLLRLLHPRWQEKSSIRERWHRWLVQVVRKFKDNIDTDTITRDPGSPLHGGDGEVCV
jgi:hypothetical protein